MKVQSGVATFTTQITYLDIPISPVNRIDKCEIILPLIISSASTSSSQTAFIYAELTSASNLRLTGSVYASGSYGTREIPWQIVEHD